MDLWPEEAALYATLVASAVVELTAPDGRGGAVALTLLTRLRQAACDPALLDLPEVAPPARSSKLEAVADLVCSAVEAGQGLLVFSSFVRLLDRADEVLRARGGCRAAWTDGRRSPSGSGWRGRWRSTAAGRSAC